MSAARDLAERIHTASGDDEEERRLWHEAFDANMDAAVSEELWVIRRALFDAAEASLAAAIDRFRTSLGDDHNCALQRALDNTLGGRPPASILQ